MGLELPQSGGSETEAEAGAKVAREQARDRAAVAQALELLGCSPVGAERLRGYDREGWPHSLDEDGDCQDARQEVLLAESLEPARFDRNGCRVASGLWRDAYTGEVCRDPGALDPGALDVDHLVPLAEAHRLGGRA